MLSSALMTGQTRQKRLIATFSPLPWQIAPWKYQGRIMLLTGAAGGGKSRLAAEKVHGFCKRYPGSTWLMLRKAREWTGKSIIPFYKQSVVGDDPEVNYLKSKGVFEYSNGSVVYSGGMKDDDQREAIRSIGGAGGLDGAWMEEGNAFTRMDFDELLGRLRHNAGGWRQLILTTNPGGSKHWIYTDLIKGKKAKVFYSGAKDNPYNPPDYFDSLNEMTGTMKERLVFGHWVMSEGAIYDAFDHRVHVQERKLDEFQRFSLACDEGYTNPAVVLLVGHDADNRWHIVSEFYERGKLQSVVCDYIYSLYQTHLPNIIAVDSAAAGMIAELRDKGIPARPAKGRVLDGILSIQNKLKIQNDDKPRLTVDPSCTNTINEFESYTWKPEKDEPIKEFDHSMDALRYLEFVDNPPEHMSGDQPTDASKWRAPTDRSGWRKY